jgi:hypothetical protein
MLTQLWRPILLANCLSGVNTESVNEDQSLDHVPRKINSPHITTARVMFKISYSGSNLFKISKTV